jgi:hypothetical protein
MSRLWCLLLTVLALLNSSPASSQPTLTAELSGLADVVTIAAVDDPGLLATLEQLESEHGIHPAESRAARLEDGTLVLALDNPAPGSGALSMFYLPERELVFFLDRRLGERGFEARLWSHGDAEILFTEESVQLLREPSVATFRLVSDAAPAPFELDLEANPEEITVPEAIECLARVLRISITATSLRDLISSASCSALNTISLALTGLACVSGNALSCTVGIGRLIACNVTACAAPPAGPCLTPIGLGQRVSGNWASNCTSQHRAGRYAKYFAFTLARQTRVQIDLESPALLVDSYMFLLRGSGTTGSVLASDDDSGLGWNARLIRTLPAGTYTVEATTYNARTTGSFNLVVRAVP